MLISCGAPDAIPARQQQRTSAVFNAPKDKVWALLIAEVGLSYPIQAIEKASGLVTTQMGTMNAGFNNQYMGKWVFPPSVFLGTWDGLRVQMRIVVSEPEPNKTQVVINCLFDAYESNVIKTWVQAQTNGAVENGILTNIEQKLATQK
jgi:hypothetical protein